jgi:hypothetical protein
MSEKKGGLNETITSVTRRSPYNSMKERVLKGKVNLASTLNSGSIILAPITDKKSG